MKGRGGGWRFDSSVQVLFILLGLAFFFFFFLKEQVSFVPAGERKTGRGFKQETQYHFLGRRSSSRRRRSLFNDKLLTRRTEKKGRNVRK